MRWIEALATVLVVGCGDARVDATSVTSAAPSTGAATTSAGTVTTSVTATTGADDDPQPPVLDVAPPLTSGGSGTEGQMGCTKVDFLFVIDNSGSMRDEQQRLAGAFGGFIAAIRDQVAGMDHHIMVIDSDDNPAWLCEEFFGGGHCAGTNMQPDCTDYTCGSVAAAGPCASTLGAGVVHPLGGFASNMDCGFPPQRRYLVSDDADLETKFACAATVGVSGNGEELPMTAMVQALQPPLSVAGGCNEGFLRDDAILVVTVVSDDPAQPMFAPNDDATAGDPAAWHDALVAAKGDNEDAIVVIGLVPFGDTSCVFPSEPTVRFVDFVQSFGAGGVLGSVCDPDYAGIFASAVSVIDTTCDNFPPAG